MTLNLAMISWIFQKHKQQKKKHEMNFIKIKIYTSKNF